MNTVYQLTLLTSTKSMTESHYNSCAPPSSIYRDVVSILYNHSFSPSHTLPHLCVIQTRIQTGSKGWWLFNLLFIVPWHCCHCFWILLCVLETWMSSITCININPQFTEVCLRSFYISGSVVLVVLPSQTATSMHVPAETMGSFTYSATHSVHISAYII